MSAIPDDAAPDFGRARRLRSSFVRAVVPLLRLTAERAHRLFDLFLAAALIAALSPLLLLLAARSWARAGRVFDRSPRSGRFGDTFERLSFAGAGGAGGLAAVFNVLAGDMSFVGPRAVAPGQTPSESDDAEVRYSSRPGLLSVYRTRKRVGVAYESEGALDREFYYGQTLKGSAGLLLRSALSAVLHGVGERTVPPVLRFFGVPVVNTTMDEAVAWMVAAARAGTPSRVAFVNPDCLNIAFVNAPYREALLSSARVLPDGIGLHMGCRIQGTALAANVNGTDLFPRLCRSLEGTGLSLYLLGGRPGVAEECAQAMKLRFPGLAVAGIRDGFFPAEKTADVVAEVNASGAAFLLVAMGAPRQELWLTEHHAGLRVPVRMGVGGLFDFYSGRISRAPQWMRDIGFEWVWRFLQEPGRMWKRYFLGNPLFLYRVWREAARGRG